MPAGNELIDAAAKVASSNDPMSVEDAVKVLTGQQTYSEMFQTLFSLVYRMIEYEQRTMAEVGQLRNELKYLRTKAQPGYAGDWTHLVQAQGSTEAMLMQLAQPEQESVINELKKEVSRLESAYQKALGRRRNQ